MAMVRPDDEGARIQADLTRQNTGIVVIREGINTADDSAAAKHLRRMMLAQGAHQAESTSERIKAGLDLARAEGIKPGRPPSCQIRCRSAGGCTRRAPQSAGWPES